MPRVPLKEKLSKRDLVPVSQFDKSKTQQKLLGELKEYLADVGRQFTAFLREKLSRPYPPASKKGMYPSKRTGSLQASVGYRVQGGQNKGTLVVGIIRDVMKGGQKERPTRYGSLLEFRFFRKLVMAAWAEFSKKVPHKMKSQYLRGTLDVVRIKGNEYSQGETMEVRGMNELLEDERKSSRKWQNWRRSEGFDGWADEDEIIEAGTEAIKSGEDIGRPSLMARDAIIRHLRR